MAFANKFGSLAIDEEEGAAKVAPKAAGKNAGHGREPAAPKKTVLKVKQPQVSQSAKIEGGYEVHTEQKKERGGFKEAGGERGGRGRGGRGGRGKGGSSYV